MLAIFNSINEGKNLLIEKFGKEYGIYFSILELISAGKTARTDLGINSIFKRDFLDTFFK